MEGKSGKLKRRKYDAEFKKQVLEMVENGRAVSEVAVSLGIGENLIYRWRSQAKARVSKEAESAGISDVVAENERLKAALRRAEQERDILKKALGIFGRES